MRTARVVYTSRAVESSLDQLSLRNTGLDGFLLSGANGEEASREAILIRTKVREALAKLSVDEREFIVLFYFVGRTYAELAESTGRALHKLEALHKRAIRRLRKELAPFVAEEFGIPLPRRVPSCPVCHSKQVEEIDAIIESRDLRSTWRPIIREIRKKFGIAVGSPQQLIGHIKYHCQRKEESDESD